MKDDLDRLVQARTAFNPEFPAKVRAAEEARALIAQLAAQRQQTISQTEVARHMGTKQPNVARLEAGKTATSLPKFIEYAHEVGYRIQLVPER